MSDHMVIDINNTDDAVYGSLNDFNNQYNNSYTPVNVVLFDKPQLELIYNSQYGCFPPSNWSMILIMLHLKEE